MKITAGIAIDLGNSETRVKVLTPIGDGRFQNIDVPPLSNVFAEVISAPNVPVVIPEEYSEDNTTMFRQDGKIWATGLYAQREGKVRIKPHATRAKAKNKAVLLALSNAFINAHKEIAKKYQLPLEEIEIEWVVRVLLPASQVASGKKIIEDHLRSLTKIVSHAPQATINIKISEHPAGFGALPEGQCAFVAVSQNEGYKNLTQGTVLIVDIGSGTTDFVIIRRGVPVAQSRDSINRGGNDVLLSLKDQLIENGLTPDQEQLDYAVVHGEIRKGETVINVKEELAYARREIAQKITSACENFLEKNFKDDDLTISTITHLMLIGGGSIASDIKEVGSLGDFIAEFFKENGLEAERVIPEIYSPQNPTPVSPRMLNVAGAIRQLSSVLKKMS